MLRHGDPAVPADGVDIAGHLYPHGLFAWIIRTGKNVDRDALCEAVGHVSLVDVRRRALSLAAQRNLSDDMALAGKISTLIRATKQALRVAYAAHGNRHPKGGARIAAEALVVRATLIEAAAWLQRQGRS